LHPARDNSTVTEKVVFEFHDVTEKLHGKIKHKKNDNNGNGTNFNLL